MKRAIVYLSVLISVVACASPVAQNDTDTLANIAREYPRWAQMFDAPRNVSTQLMLLCRLVQEDEQAYLDSEHAEYFVQVFVNPTGERLMRAKDARVFPEGAIIVKEKWTRAERYAKNSSAMTPAGLGIMLKEKDGWQYAYVDEAGIITRDQKQLEHCAACHSAQSERDSVFYPQVMSE